MKLYVAGVSFKGMKTKLDHHTKVRSVITSLSTISRDAVMACGDDVITIIVLREYALTSFSAITNLDKKKSLSQLEDALKKYKNIILIPGTFAAYEDFSGNPKFEERKNKVLSAYADLSSNHPYINNDNFFNKEYINVKDIFSNNNIEHIICLQNSAYILTSKPDSRRIKHKKFSPIDERDVLPNYFRYSFFHIGADTPIKNISLNAEALDIGISICREHHHPPTDEIKYRFPLLHVVVSATINTYIKHLFGAVNIHMDKDYGLSVYINDSHPKAHIFEQVKPVFYNFITASTMTKTDEKISHYDNIWINDNINLSSNNTKIRTTNNVDINKLCQDGKFEKLKKTLARGFNLKAFRLSSGSSLVHWAASNGQLEVLKIIHVKYPELLTEVDECGNSVLHLAIKNTDISVTKYLLQVGININCKNNQGITPLLQAVINQHARAVDFLLKNNADVTCMDNDRNTAAIYAAGHSDLEMLIKVIDKDAKLCNWQNQSGDTPLTIASFIGDLPCVKYLITKNCNYDIVNTEGRTALALAAYKNYPDIVRELIKAGANVNVNIDREHSLFDWAIENEHFDIYDSIRTKISHVNLATIKVFWETIKTDTMELVESSSKYQENVTNVSKRNFSSAMNFWNNSISNETNCSNKSNRLIY